MGSDQLNPSDYKTLLLFSHPGKFYSSHIDNIAKSFDDKNHAECAEFHDFAKQSDKFQTYITLKEEEFIDFDEGIIYSNN